MRIFSTAIFAVAVMAAGCASRIVDDGATACAGGAAGCGGQGATGTTSTGTAPCTDTTSDPKNCGTCGHDCLGGECQASVCQPVVLAAGEAWPSSIAVDAASVYWTTAAVSDGVGAVRKVGLHGGTPETLVQGMQQPTNLAVNTSAIAWVHDSVQVAVLRHGTSTPIELPSGTYGPIGMTIDDANVYYGKDGDLVKVALDGAGSAGPVVLAASAWPLSVALDATHAYWTACGKPVAKAPIAGGATVALSTGGGCRTAIAVSGSTVVWSDASSTSPAPGVWAAPSSGGAAEHIADPAFRLAADATEVYYLVQGAVMKVPLSGGPATMVAMAQSPTALALDAAAVYFTDAGTAPDYTDGRVMRVAK